jgi:hypothetical protein
MLSQFHAMFLGFYLSCETKFIMQVKFSCVPGDSHMGSPSFVCVGIGDRDFIVLIRDVFHLMALKKRTCNKMNTRADQKLAAIIAAAVLERSIPIRGNFGLPIWGGAAPLKAGFR